MTFQGFSVNLAILRSAAAKWGELAEDLTAARTRLRSAEEASADLGEKAGPAAQKYFATWLKETTSQIRASSGHDRQLRRMANEYWRLDEDAARDLAPMVAWADRNAIVLKNGLPVDSTDAPRPGRPGVQR